MNEENKNSLSETDNAETDTVSVEQRSEEAANVAETPSENTDSPKTTEAKIAAEQTDSSKTETVPMAEQTDSTKLGADNMSDRKPDIPTDEADSVSEQKDSETETDTLALAEQVFAAGESEKDGNPKKKHGMVKKQKIMIIAFALLAVVLVLAYFIFLLPYMKKLSEEKPSEPPEVLAGEVYDASKDTLLIFPHVEKNKIQSIEVHNSYGSFTCVKEKDDVFYIKEHMLSPFGNEIMSSLAVDAGYTVVSRRVTTNCEDFGKYGLAPEDNPAYYILTAVSGEKYKVFLGDFTPNGGGIYCRYEGRNALYVIPSSVAETLLIGAEGLLTPMLMLPLPNAAYAQTDQVIITKNGQPFVEILYDNICKKCGGKNKELTQEKVYECEKCKTKTPVDQYRISAYKMTYPSNHVVNDTNYSTNVLLSIASLQGQSVLKAGSGQIGTRLCDDEALMAEYGFHDFANVPYRLLYTYGEQSSAVAFAPSGAEGYYFAYSYDFDMIVLVPTATVPYLEWDILDFISSSIFAENIADVSEVTINTAEGSYITRNELVDVVEGKNVYKVCKYSISEKFFINYVQGESDNSLICTSDRTGITYDKTSPSFNYIQGFYGSMLSMYIEGYSDKTNPAEMQKYAEMTVKKKDGTELKYVFYMTGERCFYTINGSGEFYIPAYQLKRTLVNAVRAAEGFLVSDAETAPELPETYEPVSWEIIVG